MKTTVTQIFHVTIHLECHPFQTSYYLAKWHCHLIICQSPSHHFLAIYAILPILSFKYPSSLFSYCNSQLSFSHMAFPGPDSPCCYKRKWFYCVPSHNSITHLKTKFKLKPYYFLQIQAILSEPASLRQWVLFILQSSPLSSPGGASTTHFLPGWIRWHTVRILASWQWHLWYPT